mmetsp:Transcript_141608/g.200527  ORF Transcript_141608/g.200527 Transcript_141608/m.200527 type:complete len:230 (+) Transcript_141608:17-706(+)
MAENEQYVDLAIRAFAEVENFLNEEAVEPNWEYVTEVDACAMYRRTATEQDDNSGILTVRTVAAFDFPAKKIFEFIWDLKNRKKFDEYVKDLVPIVTIPAGAELLKDPVREMDVLYASFSMPFPLYGRDFVHIRAYKHDESTGVYLTSAKSTVHASRPEIPDTYVRGEINVDGFQIIPDEKDPENKSVVKYVARVNPMGSIPTFAVNLANRKVPSTMAAIRKAMVAEFK